MIVTHRGRRGVIILCLFGIALPNLLIAFLLSNPRPISWPIPARIVVIGIALNALISALFPDLDESED
jgi:hypothetical protein